MSALAIVKPAPLTPRANDFRSRGESRVLQHDGPSSGLTEVNFGELNKVSAGSNPVALTILMPVKSTKKQERESHDSLRVQVPLVEAPVKCRTQAHIFTHGGVESRHASDMYATRDEEQS